jgi:hypothetical protein
VSVPVLSGAGRMAAALALLALVGVASTSRVAGGGAVLAPRWLGLAVIVVASAVAFGGLLFVVLAGGYAAFAGTSLRGKALVAGVGAVVLAGIFIAFLLPRWEPNRPWIVERPPHCIDPGFWWFHYPTDRQEIFRHPARFCPWGGGGGGAERVAGGGGASGGTPVVLVAAVAGGAAVALIVAAAAVAIAVRRSRRGVHAPIEEEDAVVLALDQSLADLRRERDVRRAVIACYARMERALAQSGSGRRPQEAPFEYLARILGRVAGAGAAVRALTELFERAKFSVEPMGTAEKERAIAALEELRMEVYA